MLRILPNLAKPYWLKASVSKLRDGCLRRQFYRSILGLPGKESPSRSQGIDFHDVVDCLVSDEEIPGHIGPRLIEKGQRCLELLPFDPFDGWNSETLLEVPCYDLVPFKGKVDLERPGDVFDWKGTSSADFYHAKTQEQLADDVQMLTYAYVLHRDDPPPFIRVYHGNVYLGAKFKFEIVDTLVPWSACEDKWHKVILPGAQKLQEMYQNAVPEGELPRLVHAEYVPYGDEAECKAYGGCPYAPMCSAAPGRRKILTTVYRRSE